VRNIRIGTRESQLALWQANQVKDLLALHGHAAELVLIKSEGDIDLKTPLYEIGVQGIFTKTLDIALLNGQIDIAVHSMKDVPTQLAKGIRHASVLPRGSYKDILVKRVPENGDIPADRHTQLTIATSSIRRKAQWLHRFPGHRIDNLRGNINTRLQKLADSNWYGAIFAAAGLERIGLRPENSIDLDWMLPAPAQGAILVVCREEDDASYEACRAFHDEHTALCTQAERDFLRGLMGGCSTPISALATIAHGQLHFEGNIFSLDGKDKVEIRRTVPLEGAAGLGLAAAETIRNNGGEAILEGIRNGAK
jgi:hydroxymethylbilane synthase